MKHYVYYHQIKLQAREEDYHHNLFWLSSQEKERLSNFHRPQDKMTGVIGKSLLRYGLNELGYDSDIVLKLQYSEQNKPYLDDIPWNFNITHCDDLVAVVFAEKTHVGIDVERVDQLEIADFQNCFTLHEWNDIQSSEDHYARFYYYWTRKEAILKGIGSGLLIHPSLFSAMNNHVTWDTKIWNLHQVELAKNHLCFLATEDNEPEIITREIRDPLNLKQ
jgi:4'-phosphopantetheinyl transferase